MFATSSKLVNNERDFWGGENFPDPFFWRFVFPSYTLINLQNKKDEGFSFFFWKIYENLIKERFAVLKAKWKWRIKKITDGKGEKGREKGLFKRKLIFLSTVQKKLLRKCVITRKRKRKKLELKI